MKKVRIIAEIGSNYDNDFETAVAYIRAARDAGADMVKFQTLRKDGIVARDIRVGGRLERNPGYDLFASLELPDDWHARLKQKADEMGIEFFSTPFYLEAVDLLERVGVRTYKIASGDITFIPLLEAVGRTGKSVILSTGGSTLAEVKTALAILQKAGAGDVSLLHCVSNYPPAWEEMNLRAIAALQNAFRLPVGLSDHTPGDLVPIAAVALGATLIEKHVTFDRSNPGPDHPFAMTLDEFGAMIGRIRLLEKALGTGEKIPSPTELAKKHRMRRGIYDSATRLPAEGAEGIWLRPEHT